MKMRINTLRALALIAGTLALSACSSDMSDLKSFVETTKSKYQGSVEPIPQFKPYTSYEYRHEGHNPFAQKSTVDRQAEAASKPFSPDQNRRKEPLEFFPLDSLAMVGTLEREGVRWGLIKDTDGTVHRVRNGNYAGQNYGKITSITETSIDITELVQDANGLWVERISQLHVGE